MRKFLRKRKALVLEMTRRNRKPNANVTIARKQPKENVFYMVRTVDIPVTTVVRSNFSGKDEPKKKEELHTMLADSFAMAMKNMTKKKKESSKKVEFDLSMLDGLSMSEDEKSNAKMEDGEIRDKDDSSASS